MRLTIVVLQQLEIVQSISRALASLKLGMNFSCIEDLGQGY